MLRILRSLLVVAVGGFLLVVCAQLLCESPAYVMPRDFPEYWASGRLNLHGENPYDPELILATERLINPNRSEALMMWNPPPSLVLYMPLAFLPPKLAGLVWTGVQLVAVLAACNLLVRVYHPRAGSRLALVVAYGFVATWWVVVFGQNSGFLLLGLAGFVHSLERRQPLRAGAFAALTAIKPHLLAGFGVLLVLDLLTRSRRVAVLSGGLVLVMALGVALVANPQVLSQYIAATQHPAPRAVPLSAWTVPMPSYLLRMAVAPEHFSLQFLPCALGCLALVGWRYVSRRSWNWAGALPIVVAVSVLTAPYGWIFDLTVLLVPLIWALTRLARRQAWVLFGLVLLAQAAITVITLADVASLGTYWWVAPAVLALCVPGAFSRDVGDSRPVSPQWSQPLSVAHMVTGANTGSPVLDLGEVLCQSRQQPIGSSS